MKQAKYWWNESVDNAQSGIINLAWQITGAKTLKEIYGNPVLFGFDTNAGDLTQAKVDAFFPDNANEVVAGTMFGATAMGTDAFGVILNMSGQARRVKLAEAIIHGGVGDAPLSDFAVGTKTAPTDALTNTAYVTAKGNIALRFVLTGVDALTAGVIRIILHIENK